MPDQHRSYQRIYSADRKGLTALVVMLGKGHYDQAVDCYRRALKIDPNSAIAKKRLKDAELALRMRNC